MRLGGPVPASPTDPDRWVDSLRRRGYRAACWPLAGTEGDEVVEAYARAAAEAGIIIAEVGAWSNPIDTNPVARRDAVSLCQSRLALADRIGARCCVNIAGSRGSTWDGPHPDNLSPETFDLIVETVRDIIDAVKPTRTFYTLETMPWIFPHSAESYLRLIEAIGRDRFAVHLDPVNLVNSAERYFDTGALLRECFARLGPHIRSCHAKDIIIGDRLTLHLDETRPGLGALDYRTYLSELSRLDPDTPILLEHLKTEEEYASAAAHLRGMAGSLGLSL